MILLIVKDMDELEQVLKGLITSLTIRGVGNYTILPNEEWAGGLPSPTPPVRKCRLAEAPSCDKSKPPHAFVVMDENGEILVDDC